MGSWTYARPSIEKDLKALGYSDEDIAGVMALQKTPLNRAHLKAEVTKLINKKKEREAAVKNLFSELNWD